MPLMVSISGIRGVFGDGLSPEVLVRYTQAYGTWMKNRASQIGKNPLICIGRDARVTGEICSQIVAATLQSCGLDVLDGGLATTPTVEMAVLGENAVGGIILSASHNPAQWNALKLLNELGEFLTPEQGQEVLEIADEHRAKIVAYQEIGKYKQKDFLPYHIDQILALPYIKPDIIEKRNFKVVVDGINSVGGFAIPALLNALGVKEVTVLNGEANGLFAHNPEPLPEHLTEITREVAESGADLGIVVDPDADRLAFVEDGGRFFGEELTQVVAADFLMRFKPGTFVTNLSSSRAAEDVLARYGQSVVRSAVGEANVVVEMKKVNAVLGGEGNGGVILPDLHYGRDALVGTAMVLQYLAEQNLKLSEVRTQMPEYFISKNKVDLAAGIDADAVLEKLKIKYQSEKINTIDGLKIDFDNGWVHLRKSNTEPIIRIYAEAQSPQAAEALAQEIIQSI